MPRPAKTKRETSRLSLEMDTRVRQRIEEIRDLTEADSITEVIRRALKVYDLVVKETNAGGKLVLQPKKGPEREVMIL